MLNVGPVARSQHECCNVASLTIHLHYSVESFMQHLIWGDQYGPITFSQNPTLIKARFSRGSQQINSEMPESRTKGQRARKMMDLSPDVNHLES